MNAHEHIVDEAKGLLEPGEEYDNPEYTRALIELVARFSGLPYDEAASHIGVDYTKVHAACHADTKPGRYINVMDCHVVYPPEHQDALGGKDFGKVLEENNMDIAGVMIEVTESGVVKIRPKTSDEEENTPKVVNTEDDSLSVARHIFSRDAVDRALNGDPSVGVRPEITSYAELEAYAKMLAEHGRRLLGMVDNLKCQIDEACDLIGPGGDGTLFGRIESLLASSPPSKGEPFVDELRDLINAHNMENGSDTPDFVLADYLRSCLYAFDTATQRRDKLQD